MKSLPVKGHGGASCASAPRNRAASSAAVSACTQIIGRSGTGARADAGRTAAHRRPRYGSHTAHAGNSRCKAMTWLMACRCSGPSPASASGNGGSIPCSSPRPAGALSNSTAPFPSSNARRRWHRGSKPGQGGPDPPQDLQVGRHLVSAWPPGWLWPARQRQRGCAHQDRCRLADGHMRTHSAIAAVISLRGVPAALPRPDLLSGDQPHAAARSNARTTFPPRTGYQSREAEMWPTIIRPRPDSSSVVAIFRTGGSAN